MPDITMCSGDGCEAKGRCYRHIAPYNPEWQAFFTEPPGDSDSCEYFIPPNGEAV